MGLVFLFCGDGRHGGKYPVPAFYREGTISANSKNHAGRLPAPDVVPNKLILSLYR